MTRVTIPLTDAMEQKLQERCKKTGEKRTSISRTALAKELGVV